MSKWDGANYNTCVFLQNSIRCLIWAWYSGTWYRRSPCHQQWEEVFVSPGLLHALLPSWLLIITQAFQAQWQVLFKRSSKHSPASQLSSSATAQELGWQLVGPQANWDLRKETATKTNSILGCRSTITLPVTQGHRVLHNGVWQRNERQHVPFETRVVQTGCQEKLFPHDNSQAVELDAHSHH